MGRCDPRARLSSSNQSSDFVESVSGKTTPRLWRGIQGGFKEESVGIQLGLGVGGEAPPGFPPGVPRGIPGIHPNRSPQELTEEQQNIGIFYFHPDQSIN